MKYIITSLCLFVALSVSSQSSDSKTPRNTIYVTPSVGFYLIPDETTPKIGANISYERFIKERKDHYFSTVWVKLRYEKFIELFNADYSSEGNNYMIGVVALSGSASSHLELNLGIELRHWEDPYGKSPTFNPVLNIGYRFQK